MGMERPEPTIQETLEEMGELEDTVETNEEKKLYKDTVEFEGAKKVEVITEHEKSDEEILKENFTEDGDVIPFSTADVIQHNPLIDADVLNPMISVEDRVIIATRVADSLKKVLESQNLIQKIGSNNYVTVSGWSTLGTMIGIRVEIEKVEPFPTKARHGYRAKVNLIDGRGVKVGEGEAIATSSGKQKEEHAVYSMAITRATGKAFRLSLAWIMELAGYSSTPYEEMPESMTN
ncbi:hypothetical protein [uncultured Methanobrevibacter sp.]|uniref:hypothetical protein n=1 Tax=uncultured Methanobrevibacter sp. TaxID=253161 RepID=UPI0025E76C88|nr:hypothetical protein [uncultured Methanobrevibacter sp.]